MFHVPNRHRLRKHKQLGSDDSIGNNGFFIIPHYKIIDYEFNCQASDGDGWEHVSVSISSLLKKRGSRCPTWEEMCFIKSIFWDETDTVIEFHPAKENYVNIHDFVLHLWKPIGIELPLPNTILV